VAYIGQRDHDPITPDEAPGDRVQELFQSMAERYPKSRGRIILCREVRRGLHTVKIDQNWSRGSAALEEWVTCVLPERQMIPLNLTNLLSAEEPVITRNPKKQNDLEIRRADESETWCNAMREQMVPWEDIVAKLTEDAELGVVVLPSPAAMEYAPDFTSTFVDAEGKKVTGTNPEYIRDAKGKKPDDKGYTEESGRASMAAWAEAYRDHLAMHPPFIVRLINATDCAPILVRGRNRDRFECRGIVTRTLFEREELLKQKYRWDGFDNVAHLPRGFNAENTFGQDGQLFLYEAFLTYVDERTGEETPFIARSVGGLNTWTIGDDPDEKKSACINLREEFGVTRLMAGYFFGMHAADDDPDWLSVPILYPLIQTILNSEGLKSSAYAHAYDNAFTGHVAVPDKDVPPETYLETSNQLKTFRKPKADEIKLSPGPIQPWAQAHVGDDVWRLIADASQSLQINMPNEEQTGGETNASGHAMVVSHELLISAKRHIKEGSRRVVEFIMECIVELSCGLARGQWEALNGYGVQVPAYHDIARTIESSGKSAKTSEVIVFDERWFGTNYTLTADYPAVGNLADRSQKMEMYAQGMGTFREMREAFGDTSPETTRREILADKFLDGPVGQLSQLIEIVKERGMREVEQALKGQLAGELTKMGVPVDAMAPELQELAAQQASMAMPGAPVGAAPGGAPAAPPQGPTAIGDLATNSLNGTIAGEVGQAARQNDAMAQVAVGGGG
jgi:hypothetical protein